MVDREREREKKTDRRGLTRLESAVANVASVDAREDEHLELVLTVETAVAVDKDGRKRWRRDGRGRGRRGRRLEVLADVAIDHGRRRRVGLRVGHRKRLRTGRSGRQQTRRRILHVDAVQSGRLDELCLDLKRNHDQ